MSTICFCGRPAVAELPYASSTVCRTHFLKLYWSRVKRNLTQNKLVEKGDHIALALSGGKDSVAMAFSMWKLLHNRKDIKLTAVTVDEGIDNYRSHGVAAAAAFCKTHGLKHVVVSFAEQFGRSLDSIAKETERAPCTYCGVFRRYLLNRTAREIGATKVATGHNLDDESQSNLMNVLRGDMKKLVLSGPTVGIKRQSAFVQRIKPLRSIPEKENALFCMLLGLEPDYNECPHAGLAFRNEVRDLLNALEVRHPGTKQTIQSTFDKILAVLKTQPTGEARECSNCGELTSKDICQTCVLLDSVKIKVTE